MNKIVHLIIFILLSSCSFDDKSGIWKNSSKTSKKEKSLFNDFKTLSSEKRNFDRVILPKKNFVFILDKKINNKNWKDIFSSKTNNLANFTIADQNKLIFKSKKLNREELSENILYYKNQIILSDISGSIITYSLEKKKIISKFNFYKKKYKKINKKLNFIIEDNIVYVSDNIGFLYAISLKENKIIWAKNFKKPFRSNLKIFNNKIITSNENSDLYFLNKLNGDIIRLIPTEETTVKNEFKNNLSLTNNAIFFINTFGSLYSIDLKSMKINWFINLNPNSNLNYGNLFIGTEVVNNGKIIAISSKRFTYIIDALTGSILFKKNFSLQIRPILINNYLFSITKSNMLLALDLVSGNIIYSFNLNKKIADFLKVKKKNVEIKSFVIANDHIFVFLKNSFFLKLNINGELMNIDKLPSKINSKLIFINNSIVYLNNKNKIIEVN